MAECPNVITCKLFPLFKMAGSLEVWKINYCTSEFARCARYQRTLKGESVSDTLLPNGKQLKLT